ncbi:MAG: hypothetical protein ACI9OJ_002318 [Myxococcota bacterium]
MTLQKNRLSQALGGTWFGSQDEDHSGVQGELVGVAFDFGFCVSSAEGDSHAAMGPADVGYETHPVGDEVLDSGVEADVVADRGFGFELTGSHSSFGP